MKQSRATLALLVLASCLVGFAAAQSCTGVCTVSGTALVNTDCVSQCNNCAWATPYGCATYFQPVWNYNAYLSASCSYSCSSGLAWWSWLLISIAILTVSVGVGLGVYVCLRSARS
ncbi:hypothetical protein CLOM_g6732 [Closterium sp. NIES-68]|nr:hypothetical protein CLOM_g2684 [Closterium sp. NIES-68]GJP47550.1 hypothetical protein CLOM_g6732 [Closterium sp. NIES-68]GJP73464.1 hypothetical protein CLOP_g4175 [Closterium sp. NIES-67]